MNDKDCKDYRQILGKELSRFALHSNLDCINDLENKLRCKILEELQIPKESKDDVLQFMYDFFVTYRKKVMNSYR